MMYKGIELDGAIFTSTTDIDNFLKTLAINSYKTAVKAFADHPDIEHGALVEERAEYLADQFGMDWEEIEVIEMSAIAA